jgi:hypothetical protein
MVQVSVDEFYFGHDAIDGDGGHRINGAGHGGMD